MKRLWLQAAVAVDFSSNLLVTGRAPKIARRLQISGSKVTLSLANLPQRLASSILYERCISTSLPWKLHNKYGKSTKEKCLHLAYMAAATTRALHFSSLPKTSTTS